MSFKRIKPNYYVRIVAGWRSGVTVFLALATVFGFWYGVSPQGIYGYVQQGITTGIILLLFSILLALITAYSIGRLKPLPDTIVEELNQECSYSCKPCTRDNLEQACEIVKPLFKKDHVDYLILEQWRSKNPQGFMQITNEQEELTGCFVILGLQNNFMTTFKSGVTREGQITWENVLNMKETRQATSIYISGIMVRDPSSFLGAKRTRIMLWCMLQYIKHHFNLNNPKEFFAVPLNKESELLANKSGFKICSNESGRVDKHHMYSINLTKQLWDQLSIRVGDFSKMCKVKYSIN